MGLIAAVSPRSPAVDASTGASRAQLKRAGRVGIVATVWVGLNWIALAALDWHESRALAAEFGVPAGVIRSYERREIDLDPHITGDAASLSFRYRSPARWTGSRAVPLVVFLHGSGERGADNLRQLRSLPAVLCEDPLREDLPCAVLAPQCPQGMHWSARLNSRCDVLDGVMRMIDGLLADRGIDPDRIYLVGYSMGGNGAWELAMRHPERFAAVVPLCGGGDAQQAGRLVGVPLWAIHGAADDVVPISHSRTMVAAVERAGGSPHYLELAGVGHNCWPQVFRADSEVLRWMFRQRRFRQ